MSYLDSIKCLKCNILYDETRKPCLGTCSHTICLVCRTNLSEPKCPICGEQNAFREEKINRLAIEARQMMTANIKTPDDVSELAEQLERTAIEDLVSGPCSLCQSDTRELRLCTACADPALIEFYRGKWTLISDMFDNKAPFLKLKTMGICSDCILDGQHKGHNIVLMRNLNLKFPMRKRENVCTLKAVAMLNNLEEAQKNPKWRFLYFIRMLFLVLEIGRAQLKEDGTSEMKSSMAALFSGERNPNYLNLHRKLLVLMDQLEAYFCRLSHRIVDLFKMIISRAKRELQGATSEECREIAEWIRKMEDVTGKIRLDEIEHAEEKFRWIDAEVAKRKSDIDMDVMKLLEELVSKTQEEPKLGEKFRRLVFSSTDKTQMTKDVIQEFQKTRTRDDWEKVLRLRSELDTEMKMLLEAFVEVCECSVKSYSEFITLHHYALVKLAWLMDNSEQEDIRDIMSLGDAFLDVIPEPLWNHSL